MRQETYTGVEKGRARPAEKTHQQHIKGDYGKTWPVYTHRQSSNNVDSGYSTWRMQARQHTGDKTTNRRGEWHPTKN